MDKIKNLPFVVWILKHKRPVAVALIAVTVVLLGSYVSKHPESINRLLRTSPQVLIALVVLYSGVIATNAVITYATVRLCRHELSPKSSMLLTIYSTIVNFFGPLQSGPGVRAVYLKTTVGLRIRDYTLATFFYFVTFAALNISLLFVNSLPYLTVLGVLAGIVSIAFGVKKFHFADRSRYVFVIFLITFVQILLMAIIFFVELNATGAVVNFMQALSYGASANLSLFVSVTPGAIGIREAFILFATSLHHVPLGSVVAAGILDRAFYVIFLILLFVLSTSLHLKDSLTGKKLA